jgi:excisionase family DNA binding protein
MASISPGAWDLLLAHADGGGSNPILTVTPFQRKWLPPFDTRKYFRKWPDPRNQEPRNDLPEASCHEARIRSPKAFSGLGYSFRRPATTRTLRGHDRMGERLHPEEVPKTLADFQAWLQETLEGLQKDVDFYHNVPGHMDQNAFPEAADLVAQAGIFGLSFVPAEILGELCRPRKGMSPTEAAICIRKYLDWCQGKDQAAPSPQATKQELDSAQSEYLSIKDAAKVAGLSPTKIRREVKAGRLLASDTGTASHPHYRIARSDLQAWMEKNKGGTEAPPRNPVFKRKIKSRFFGEI